MVVNLKKGEDSMSDFVIVADSACDLTYDYCRNNDIFPIRIKYSIDDTVFEDSMRFEDQIDFYNKMRAGAKPRTSQINTSEFVDFWTPFVKEGKTILSITLGSAISGTYNNALNAVEIIKENYPDANIFVVDSLGASLSIAVLIDKAVEMRNEGKDISEVIKWLEDNKHNVHAIYTTDTLIYLNRSGRLSKSSLIVANVLGIRPILKLDYEGKLIAFEKMRGKENVQKRIAEIINDLVIDPEKQNLYVAHADNIPYAEETEKLIFGKTKFKGKLYSQIGATVGAHAGPGLIAYYFLGKERI